MNINKSTLILCLQIGFLLLIYPKVRSLQELMSIRLPNLNEAITLTLLEIVGYICLLITSSIIVLIAELGEVELGDEGRTLEHTDYLKPQTHKKPEEQDWYQQALKQHQIGLTEEESNDEA